MVRLTPKGRSVRPLHFSISLRRSSGVGCVSAVMKPSAPALATAATSSARPTHCMPPCTIGCSTPNNSVNLVLINFLSLDEARRFREPALPILDVPVLADAMRPLHAANPSQTREKRLAAASPKPSQMLELTGKPAQSPDPRSNNRLFSHEQRRQLGRLPDFPRGGGYAKPFRRGPQAQAQPCDRGPPYCDARKAPRRETLRARTDWLCTDGRGRKVARGGGADVACRRARASRGVRRGWRGAGPRPRRHSAQSRLLLVHALS